MKSANSSVSSVQAKPFANQRAWDAWLRKNHRISDGLWLQFAKKGGDGTSVAYSDALDSALCFGWIDGKKMALDDSCWLQRFTPRAARSLWSKVNRTKAPALIAQGRMQSAGLNEVERANRYAVLWRIQTAKKPGTRAKRITTYVAMLAKQEKLHP